MIIANELERNVLVKREEVNTTIQEFVGEVRHEFHEFTKLNPIILILIGGFILSIIVFYLFARLKYPEGRSTIIFTFVLMIVDFCFDVIFVIYNVGAVPVLFFPSLLTLLVPAGFNLLFAFILMVQQAYSNKLFREWLHRNHAIAGGFTILTMINIEVFRVLTSNFLHLDVFKAPFSHSAKKWLFIAGLFNVIVEDIPQFVILILYFKGVGTNFTLIPLLTLVISFLSLLSTVINRVFELVSFPSSSSTFHTHNRNRNSFYSYYHYPAYDAYDHYDQ
ncbi:hypothetical protein C1645_803310 [Glomus cerebriforme]|uniref:Uncharacterized protein n=1 Tax=Glomus cerebriforme TaxID=658196 RepID=A0A397T9I0_9GLOM|nr:hypothetical protein C1645_803310 [Glomus cerebriforme]